MYRDKEDLYRCTYFPHTKLSVDHKPNLSVSGRIAMLNSYHPNATCRLCGAKPLSEPMLDYYQWDP